MTIRAFLSASLICASIFSANSALIQGFDTPSLPRDAQLGGRENESSVKPDKSKRISKEAPASQLKGKNIVNRIAATVNGRPITANEVAMHLGPVVQQLAARYPKQGPEFYKQLALSKREIIEDLINRELLLAEFEGMGGQIRESLIDQDINHTILYTFNGNREAFLKNLNAAGMTIRAHRESVKKKLQVRIMRQMKYDDQIPPTPEEMRKEYEATKMNFRDQTKDKIKFKKIFIPLQGEDLSATPEVQLNLADLIAQEIKRGKATFAEMATRYSRDMYAEKGGDWPTVERGTLSAEAADIIFNAKPGELVGPLVDSAGFTIVLVEKIRLAPPPPLSKIKDEIDKQARDKRSFARYQQWLSRLKKKAIIKTYI